MTVYFGKDHKWHFKSTAGAEYENVDKTDLQIEVLSNYKNAGLSIIDQINKAFLNA
jgi:hypothetical protein